MVKISNKKDPKGSFLVVMMFMFMVMVMAAVTVVVVMMVVVFVFVLAVFYKMHIIKNFKHVAVYYKTCRFVLYTFKGIKHIFAEFIG